MSCNAATVTPPISQTLWEEIADFELDQIESGLVFSERLARENGWTLPYARRAIREYKRFLYLAVTVEHVVCPSDAVDQVWHMHLTYTRSYWDELCGGIVSLHFRRGGPCGYLAIGYTAIWPGPAVCPNQSFTALDCATSFLVAIHCWGS